MTSKTTNSIFTLILFCLGFVLTTGCSEDVTNNLLGRTPVKVSASFAPLDNGETRAATTLNTEQGFTVSSTAAYNQVRINVDNTDYVYSFSGTAGSSSTTLTTSGQPYFPAKVNAVDVYAHYPNVTLSNGSYAFTVQQDQTSTDDYLQSDLMTADCTQASRQLTNGSWQVTEAALRFKHQMAKIVIRARSEDTDYIKVNTVTLNRAKPTTTLTYQNGAYSVSAEATGTAANMPIITGSAHTTEQEWAVLIPPQTFTAGTLVTVNVQYKDPAQEGSQWVARDLTFSFTDTKRFDGGCVYTMDITVGVEFITLNNGNVDLTGWNTDDKQLWISPTITKSGLASLARIAPITATRTFTGGPLKLNPLTDIVVTAKENIHSTSYSKTLKYTPDGKDGDFIVTYVNNIHAGTNTATVKIAGVNDYSGALEAKFSILRKSITEEHVTIAAIPDQTYDGETKEPALTITDNESGTTNELHVNADYTVDYGADNTNVGTKTVTITGIGDYQGSTSTTYRVVKASGGICTFTESSLRYYLPTNRTETYTPVIATLDGDPAVTVTASSNNTSVAEPVSNSTMGTITIKGAGTATITLAVTGQNYTYANQTMTVTVKQGPILPIMYVAPVNMLSTTEFAVNNWSTSCCYMSWVESRFGDYNTYNLKQNGVAIDGKSYHIPSYYEWCSIVPNATGCIRWMGELATNPLTGQSDDNVRFGVTSSHSSNNSDTDYNYAVNANGQGWTSDYYSKLDGTTTGSSATAYALRFKGSDYCCAYRYDLLVTNYSNMSLTENSYGKTSLVIRVIYLGKNTTETINTVRGWSDSYWETNTDFKVSLPLCGQNSAASAPGQRNYGSAIDNGYYYSATQLSNSYYFLIINVPWSTDHNSDYDVYINARSATTGLNIRMFRDAY